MATQTLKRTRAKFVSEQTLEQVSASLQELPEKTPEHHSLRQTVEQLREPIEAALAKGYSYEDLIPMLREQGINIQPSTLKRYILTGSNRSKTKRLSSNKTKQVRKKPEPSTTTEETLGTTEVAAPAPTENNKKTKAPSEAKTPAPASAKRGRAAATVTSPPTASETVEEQPTAAKQSRSRRTASASATAKTKSRTSTTSTRGRKTAKA